MLYYSEIFIWYSSMTLIFKPIAPTGRVDSIDSISKKISNLGTELVSFCPENELVIDNYADLRTTLSDHDDNMFGFGNLEIDYRAPKQVTRRSSISTRGL